MAKRATIQVGVGVGTRLPPGHWTPMQIDAQATSSGLSLDQRQRTAPVRFGLWTRQIAATLIEQKFGVSLGVTAVGSLSGQCQGRILVCHLPGGTNGRAVCETSQKYDAGTKTRGALDRRWFDSAQNTRREAIHRQHPRTPDDARSSRLRARPEPR